jgi:RNA polymerase sigma-70 factor (ECF subfamily)
LLRAYRYALALTHDEWLANDLLGEACLSVLKAKGPLADHYLLKAVRSRFIDHCRRPSTPREVSLNGAATVAAEDPPGRTDAGETPETLERALAALRPQEREAIFLHAVAGLTVREIAGICELPRGTVLSLLQRGRRKVAERLGHPDGKVNAHE